MKRYKLAKPPTMSVAETYVFNFTPVGWATFTICEDTGELNIQSDWGSSSYSWSYTGRGSVSLKEFLADRTHVGYLVDKLCRGTELDDVVDGKKMATEFRKLVPEYIKNHATPRAAKDLRQEVLEDIKDWCQEIDGRPKNADIWSRVPESIHLLCGGEPWYFGALRMSHWTVVWKNLLLPTFVRHLKKLGYGRPQKPVAEAAPVSTQ